MEFRWIALLSLWTLLIGPVVAIPNNDGPYRPIQAQTKYKAVKPTKANPVVPR